MSSARRMIDAIDQFAASVGFASEDATGSDDSIALRWDALRRAGIDDPGARFAGWVDLALVGGVVPPLLANCVDVATMLELLVRFHPLWGDDDVCFEPVDGGGARVRLRAQAGRCVHPDTSAAFFSILSRMLAQVTRPAVVPTRERHRGADLDVAMFSETQLRSRLAAADPFIGRMLVGYAETELGDRNGWLDDVRLAIRNRLQQPPTLRAIAHQLACSQRTLQLRLADEQTTFTALLDDERRLLALALLANRTRPITTISLDVGYRSMEGFTRAFRRWTGTSPTQWRAAQSATPPVC